MSQISQGQMNEGFVRDDVCTSNPPTNLTNKETSKPKETLTIRDNWDFPIEFLLSCISMSVGLGNIWRFPFTAYANGGGAFLIPYLIVLIFIGRPIYYLEMCLGQFSSCGQVKIWSMSPFFKGVGYGKLLHPEIIVIHAKNANKEMVLFRWAYSAAIASACCSTYYCSLMALTLFYLFSSFKRALPWSVCNPNWIKYCAENGTQLDKSVSLAELYYHLEAFPQKDNIDDGIGYPEYRLVLCLLTVWILIFFSLSKGIKSLGKVAYFTAIFPYIVLFVLLIRGSSLKGSWKGIKYFINPNWDKILEPGVWFAAVGQCFFSLTTGFGPIIMFSSYNSFRHNVYRDALIISVMDTATSLLAGITIFAVLGNLSYTTGSSIEQVTKGGPGLAFVSYPAAIATFDWAPQLFSALFFLMLLTLGLGSATSMVEALITILCDQFGHHHKQLVTLVLCFTGFGSGLIYTAPGGHFILTLVDHFGASFVVYIVCMIEVSAVAWIYGVNNICNDIQFMTNRKLSCYWKICWSFVIPVGLFAILTYKILTMVPLKHEGVKYPPLALGIGWTLTTFSLSIILIWGLHGVLSRKSDTWKEKLYSSLCPSKRWGPVCPQLKAEWIDWKNQLNN